MGLAFSFFFGLFFWMEALMRGSVSKWIPFVEWKCGSVEAWKRNPKVFHFFFFLFYPFLSCFFASFIYSLLLLPSSFLLYTLFIRNYFSSLFLFFYYLFFLLWLLLGDFEPCALCFSFFSFYPSDAVLPTPPLTVFYLRILIIFLYPYFSTFTILIFY